MASYLVRQTPLKPWRLVTLLNQVILYSQEVLAHICSAWTVSQVVDDSLVVSPKFQKRNGFVSGEMYLPISISAVEESSGEIILDYGRCEGGVPVFEISTVTTESETVEFDVVYSETLEGINYEQGVQSFNRSE